MLSTPLNALHRELGARMAPFAGFDMPVQFPGGIIKEHLHTRRAAGLFDVSHMGQVVVGGAGAGESLESLLPVDLLGLAADAQLYALLTNEAGGVRDDLIVARWSEREFFLVLNAACKERDLAYLRQRLPGLRIEPMERQALLALQGPHARRALARIAPESAGLTFMTGARAALEGAQAYIACSGYTGEDGFEISLPAERAEALARRLLAMPEVRPAGLGARDSLRLEAGLCLYGHELGERITPVEAGLMWSLSRARRPGGERAGGFPGAERIFAQQRTGSSRKRVGLVVDGGRPVREGQKVLDGGGAEVGAVTSGAYGASVGKPVAMAYVASARAQPGQELAVVARGREQAVRVARMPLVPQRYHRG